MLQTISVYMTSRKESNLSILSIQHSGTDHPDALKELWLVVQELVENGCAADILEKGNRSLDVMADTAVYEVPSLC